MSSISARSKEVYQSLDHGNQFFYSYQMKLLFPFINLTNLIVYVKHILVTASGNLVGFLHGVMRLLVIILVKRD